MEKEETRQDVLNKDIINRLDALISIMLNPMQNFSVYERAKLLRDSGLKNKEIGKILGKSESHIRKELSVGSKRGVDNGKQ